MKIKIILILMTLLLTSACSEDNSPVTPPVNIHGAYIVINEGLYGQNNASVTIYDYGLKETHQNVYSEANGGTNLGDTGNDFSQCCGKGFIVLDKSKKIEIVDLENFNSLGYIDFTEYGNPRNIVIPDSARAFVTTLNNTVVEFNPCNYEIVREINVGDLPEGLTAANGKLFVANSGFGLGNTVSVIDLETNRLIATIHVKTNPRYVLEDGHYVYVVSSGEYLFPGTGAVMKIDPFSLDISDTLALNGNPGKSEIAESYLYVINNSGLVKISLENFQIVDETFISGEQVNSLTGVIYSVKYDKLHKCFLLGNPKDFMQNGEVCIFARSGEFLEKFPCGINPGTISIKYY